MIPRVYRPPLGLPLNWRDDQSGRLPAAVRAYISSRVEGGTALASSELALVRDYCDHYINAPCWTATVADDEEAAERLSAARSNITAVTTADELSAWIRQVLALGMDPL